MWLLKGVNEGSSAPAHSKFRLTADFVIAEVGTMWAYHVQLSLEARGHCLQHALNTDDGSTWWNLGLALQRKQPFVTFSN